MPIPRYILELRRHIGHELLLLPGVCAVPFNSAGEVLLHRRADTGEWAALGGILEPGEEPAAAVVREVLEETGVRVKPRRITGVYLTPVTIYSNGDRCQYVITAFACTVVGGEPRVNDDESLEVRSLPTDRLPAMRTNHRRWVEDAAANLDQAYFTPPGE